MDDNRIPLRVSKMKMSNNYQWED